MNFRHFKTLKEAKAHIAAAPDVLVYRKYKNRAKPYMVGSSLAFLHFA
tara:strand:+ start:158 stop:301 length:144 start_codon:yes stop_codon:yes gene_type:complete